MTREEDKHRSPAYVPDGPVRIASGNPLADAIKRIEVLEAQVASLQRAMPKGIATNPICGCGDSNCNDCAGASRKP